MESDHPYRVSDLCRATGLTRQAIHFYAQRGLLPPGRKTGRTMARYSEEHLQRLLAIRQLQQERFLPLRAVKAVLDGEERAFPPAQRRLLSEVKRQLPPRLRAGPASGGRVQLQALCRRLKVQPREVRRLAKQGMFEISGGSIAREDAWKVELWAEVRRVGLTEARGISPDVMGLFEGAVRTMFEGEVELLGRMVERASPAEVAALVERALPLIHDFIVRRHLERVRAFFGGVQ